MKVGTSATADTLTFVFGRSSLGNPAGQPVGDLTVATKPYTEGASGKPIRMDGDQVIQVRFMHMSLQNDVGSGDLPGAGQRETRPAGPATGHPVRRLRGQMGYYIGFDGPAAPRSSASARTSS